MCGKFEPVTGVGGISAFVTVAIKNRFLMRRFYGRNAVIGRSQQKTGLTTINSPKDLAYSYQESGKEGSLNGTVDSKSSSADDP